MKNRLKRWKPVKTGENGETSKSAEQLSTPKNIQKPVETRKKRKNRGNKEKPGKTMHTFFSVLTVFLPVSFSFLYD